jgi:MFS family permease
MASLRPSVPFGPRTSGLMQGPRAAFRWTAFVLGVTAFSAAVSTPLYPVYAQRFGFSPGVLGLVFGAYTLGVLATLFFAAPRAERVGRRNLLSLGMLFVILSSVVFAFASNVLWLAIGRVLAGLAVGATTSVATAAMADLEPERDQHHVARVAVAANFGAVALGVVLSGVAVQYAPDAIQSVYLMPVVMGLLGLAVIRATPETASALGQHGGPRVQRIAVPPDLRRPFWVAAGGLAACYSIYGLFAALIPSYVRGELLISSPLVAGGIVALMFGAAASIQLATAQLRDRRALLVGFPLLLGALVALVLVLPREAGALLAAVAVVLGAAVGLAYMGSVTLIDRLAPETKRGEVLAGFYCTGYLALAIPTIGIAELSERIGLTEAGVLFGLVLGGAVALLYGAVYLTPTPAGGGGRPRAGSARDGRR